MIKLVMSIHQALVCDQSMSNYFKSLILFTINSVFSYILFLPFIFFGMFLCQQLHLKLHDYDKPKTIINLNFQEYLKIACNLNLYSKKMSKSQKRKYSGQLSYLKRFPGDCSQQQLNSLEQFRTIVIKHNNGKLNPEWDQIYLLRFLRARKFVMKDTEKMWKDFIAWRVKNNVDNLYRRYYFPELTQIRKMYPHGYHKHDKKYRPIYIERLGFTEVQEIFKFTTPQRLLSYYTMLYETLLNDIFRACTEQKKRETGDGTRVMQTCTILDLKDIKLMNVSASYKFVKPASLMAQDNYPEILGNMFILNAPFLFTGIWAIVKMWIDDKTKEKIQILGSSYKKELARYADPQSLPDFLQGGTCKCPGGCLGGNIGPWNPERQQYFPHCFNEDKGQTQKERMKEQNEEKYLERQVER